MSSTSAPSLTHRQPSPQTLMATIATDEYHHNARQVHVVVMGMNGAGKSALVVRYLTKRYIGEYDTFLENTYQKIEMLKPENVPLHLTIIDTFDHESLEVEKFIRLSDIVVFVYAINSQESFQRIRHLLEQITEQDNQFNLSYLIIGNKMDLEHFRVVPTEEGQRLASQYNSFFVELSCADAWQPIRNAFCASLRHHLTVRAASVDSGSTCDLDQNGLKKSTICESAHLQTSTSSKAVSPNKRNLTNATALRFFRDKFAKK